MDIVVVLLGVALIVIILATALWIKSLPDNGGQIFWMSDE